MSHRDIKDQLFRQFARMGKPLASPRRLELLDLLSQGEKDVETLTSQCDSNIKSTSAHLKELRLARLVDTRREGVHIFYRLANPAVFQFLRSLQALARQQLAEAEQVMRLYFEDRHSLEPVSGQELLRRMRKEGVTLLDVRPVDEFRAGHIAGAISIPSTELHRRVGELKKKTEIIAYCRGPYCLFALEAVETLRRHGFRAYRLSEGLPDWEANGLPVVRETQSSGVTKEN